MASLILDFEGLNSADKQRVNETCERFEDVLGQRQTARAEEHLGDTTGPLRALLLRELLLLECEYRFRRLDPPSWQELARRLQGPEDVAHEILELARANALDQRPDLGSAFTADAAAWLESTGRFRIVRVLGHGGFGIVYLADAPELGGEVAVKTPLPEMLRSPEFRARFLREGRAAAALQHSQIVRVLEVGEAGPVCYLVSDYVSGPNLAEWLRTREFGVPAPVAVEIVRRLAEGIHFAHEAGVLHCDLKPANVLVGPGPTPDPKVTDFGLAHVTGESLDLTQNGQILGTPIYMAPEQAQGNRPEVSPRTDVYALGVMLYELLAGHPPFPPGPVAELLHRVIHEEPVGLRVQRPDVSRDLEAVCLRCLEKDPRRRYASAAALAADLDRIREGKRTWARPRGFLGQVRRWARQRPMTAAAVLFVFALALVGLGGAAYHLHHVEQANRQLSKSLEERSLLVSELAEERSQLQTEEAKLRRQLYPEAIRRAQQLLDINECRTFLETLAEWEPQPGKEDLRGFEWFYLKRRLARGECGRLDCGAADVYSVMYGPDGATFAAGGSDGCVRLCSVSPLRVLADLPHPDEVGQVLYAPDGSQLATACDDGIVRLWSPQGVLQASLTGHTGKIRALAYSPDGCTLASCADDQAIRLWPIGEAQLSPQIVDHGRWGEVKDLAFADGGTVLMTCGVDRFLHFFHVSDGECYARLALADHRAGILTLAPGGQFCAVASPGGVVQVWDTAGRTGDPDEWQPLGMAAGFQRVRCLTFSQDARALLVAGERSVQVWSLNPFRLQSMPRGHEGRVWAAHFDPRGERALTAGTDGAVRCWDLAALADSLSVEFEMNWPRLVFLPDSAGLLVVGSSTKWISLPPPSSHKIACEELSGPRDTHAGVVAGRGETLVTMDRFGHVDRWDLRLPPRGNPMRPSRLLDLAPHLEDEAGARFGPGVFNGDGGLAALRDGAVVKVWNVAHGRPIATLADHRREVTALVFGGGDVLASGSSDATLKLWDARTGDLIATCAGHTGGIRALAFSPNGQDLASASDDRTVRVWEWRTGTERLRLFGHQSVVHGVAYSPDGRTLASGGADGTVRLWQAASGHEVLTLTPGVCAGISIAFSPDGRYLAALRKLGYETGHVVNLWDAGEYLPILQWE